MSDLMARPEGGFRNALIRQIRARPRQLARVVSVADGQPGPALRLALSQEPPAADRASEVLGSS